MLGRRNLMALAAAGSVATPALAQAERTLVVAALATPAGFDGDALKPATQNVVVQVYEGLTAYARIRSADGEERLDFSRVTPHLAESWTVSEDQKTWTFRLRGDVRSARGNSLSADDVVWSWQKSLNQKRTGAFIAAVCGVEAVDKLDDRTVRFTLKAPSEIFPRSLTQYVPAIYDTTEVRKHVTPEDPWALRWIDANTAGYGAYHLESVRQNEQAVFVANPNYFGPKPHFGRVIYRAVPSSAARVQLLLAGQVHWIEEITHGQAQELQRRTKVVRSEGTAMASVRMNPLIKPFDDPRVRRAVVLATNYDALNQVVFLGLGSRPRSMVPPVIPGHDPTVPLVERDVEGAKRLLAEAGHANGLDITLEYAGLEWWEEGVALQMQQGLAAAGIRLTPRRISDNDMRARTGFDRRDIAFFTFKDFPFVLDPIYKLFNDGHGRGTSNRNHYNSTEFDALLDQALVEGDAAKRIELGNRAQHLHAADATWAYLAYPGFFEAMPRNMTGYAWYPDYHERWKDLRPAG
ncbi:ABC transporter substrate-binding protein [Roseomonas sp. BN140053]|uniref:ABC transporter substrate-binding protein n=1 Tax=Roseomonas sp. BN140053 TaxID=3391898 RepID=UPI0039E7F887